MCVCVAIIPRSVLYCVCAASVENSVACASRSMIPARMYTMLLHDACSDSPAQTLNISLSLPCCTTDILHCLNCFELLFMSSVVNTPQSATHKNAIPLETNMNPCRDTMYQFQIDISRPESVSVPVPVSEPSASSSSSSSSSNVLVFKDHTKYVVGIKWSPDGAFLATVSHDKTVNLYKKRYFCRWNVTILFIPCHKV